MDKSIQEQTKKTLELIVLLTFLYIIVFFFFPENEKNTAEMSTLPISKFNGQTQRFQVDTDSDTKDTYIRINNETAIPGTPLTITIVNPKEPVSKWTVTWKVASSEIPVVSDSYTPTASDSENFISVKAVTPTGIPYETSVYMSSLPVLYITTNDEITDNDCPAMLHMQGNENFKKDENLLYDGEISIRLSEDSAKDLPKHPYAMTLQNSSNLLNMGDSEHWQLLANATDHTLIRNQLMFQLSEQMEFSFAPKSEHAVLIVNNDYQGIYLLCEDLIIDENHISITNWEQLAKDAAAAITEKEQGDDNFTSELEEQLCNDLNWISGAHTITFRQKEYILTDYITIPNADGGYVLQMDFYHKYADAKKESLETNFLQPFCFYAPKQAPTNQIFTQSVKTYLQAFEYALHNNDFTYHDNETHIKAAPLVVNVNDPSAGWAYATLNTDFKAPSYEGKHYTDFFDMESLVNNFLVCEFSVNWNAMRDDLFITKDCGQKATFGPVWNFDAAFGNINTFGTDTNFPDIWQTTDNRFASDQCYEALQWNRYLIKDPYFLFRVYERYQQIRPFLEDLVKKDGILDLDYQRLLAAGRANDAKWSSTYAAYNGEDFETSYQNLRTFITKRIEWLDAQFKSYNTFVRSIGSFTGSSELNVTKVTYNNDKTVTLTATVTQPATAFIHFRINGTTTQQAAVTGGTCSITIEQSQLAEKGHNLVQVLAKDQSGEIIATAGGVNNTDTRIAISNYKVF